MGGRATIPHLSRLFSFLEFFRWELGGVVTVGYVAMVMACKREVVGWFSSSACFCLLSFRVVLYSRINSAFLVVFVRTSFSQLPHPARERNRARGVVGGYQRWDAEWLREAVDSNCFGSAKGSEPLARQVVVLASQLIRASLTVVVLTLAFFFVTAY